MGSVAELLAGLREPDRHEILETLTPEENRAILSLWHFWARPEQRTPEHDWHVWCYVAGRGAGKTRTGAEWVRERVDAGVQRVHLVSRTAADVRDVMVEGESGLRTIFPEHQRPIYESSKRRVVFHTGAVALMFSSEEPDQLRGPQCAIAWADEICAWKYLDETWANLMMGLRLGDKPQVMVTTTPRPITLLKQLLADPGNAVTRGSTFDNRSNLAAKALAYLRAKYEGTARGAQELYAAILDESPGALWRRAWFETQRREAPDLRRVVVAVDPSASSEGNEAGIVIAGIGSDKRGYVLADRSVRGSPAVWGRRAVDAFHEFRADKIVAEKNQGGEMVEHVLRTVDPKVPIKLVSATRGKQTRAEPIAALYEQGKISHVLGTQFTALEDQCCTWDPVEDNESPDRLDALVWAFTELMLGGAQPVSVSVGGGLSAPSYWRS